MKKITIILCAIILCSFKVDTSETQIKSLLTSGKWFVESVQEIGQEPEKAENKNDEWVVFHKEGKVEENLYGEITNATWEYSDKDKSIKVTGNDVVYKKIIEITETKLTIELIEDVNDDNHLMINYIK